MLPNPQSALVLLNIQQDFLPGGVLPALIDAKIEALWNGYVARFSQARLSIFAIRTIYPEHSKQFIPLGGKVPPHCVRGTAGAELSSRLTLYGEWVVQILDRDMNGNEAAVSAFHAKDRSQRSFSELLTQQGIKQLFVGGVLTGDVLKATVLEACQQGFQVVLLRDAIAGASASEVEGVVNELRGAGAELTLWMGPAPN